MTPAEVTALLGVCSAFDNRKPNAEMVQAWTAAMGDLSFIACRDAVVAHFQESSDWIMPSHIRGRVRRERATRIANDEVLELPPHDPDDTQAHIAALRWARAQAAEGAPYQPEGLVAGSIRELGGPVRRVNEVEADELAEHAEKLRAARNEGLRMFQQRREQAAKPTPVFACEHHDGTYCGEPAAGVSTDGRSPLCADHLSDEEESA